MIISLNANRDDLVHRLSGSLIALYSTGIHYTSIIGTSAMILNAYK